MLLRHLASNNVLLALSVMHVDFKRKISYIRIFFRIFVRTFINRHGLHGFWTTVGSDYNRFPRRSFRKLNSAEKED